MKPIFGTFLLAGIGLLFAGCVDFATHAFRLEQTAANVSQTVYAGYATGLTNGTIHITPQQSNEIRSARIKVAACGLTLDAWLNAYATNSAVKPQVQAALDSVLDASSNLVYTINLFRQ